MTMNEEKYLDYTVEEDVNAKTGKSAKNYPAIKIVAMVLGIIGALGYLYYAIQNVFQPYMEQFALIAEYKAMGQEIPAITLVPYYISMILICCLIVAPIVGSLLPVKFKSTAILLIAIPFAWQSIDVFPAIISYLSQGATMADIYVYVILCLASLLLLAAAILTAIAGKENKASQDDEMEIEYYEYEENEGVTDEAVCEEANEVFEEVTEEATEEVTEESEDENKE